MFSFFKCKFLKQLSIIDKSKNFKNCLTWSYDLCNIMYFTILYMDFYLTLIWPPHMPKSITPLCAFTFLVHRLLHFQSLKNNLTTFESVFYSFNSLATLVMDYFYKLVTSYFKILKYTYKLLLHKSCSPATYCLKPNIQLLFCTLHQLLQTHSDLNVDTNLDLPKFDKNVVHSPWAWLKCSMMHIWKS